jgi:endoglucanase
LHTSGRWIVDSSGQRVKLASVNWDGAESPEHVVAGLDRVKLGDIAHWIKVNGFNSVRLPWSNEMYEHNPKVKDEYLAANPGLKGKRALEILDDVIDALGHEGLLVLLDNHVSRADWCCTEYDGNGLWHTDKYPADKWVEDWKGIVARYKHKRPVVGAELRNEVRPANGVKPTWADWAEAAERAGNAVLSVHPDLLIIVGGLKYQADLQGVGERQVHLKVNNRLVYAPHAYKGLYDVKHGYEKFKEQLGQQWGYILAQGKAYTAPLWVSEFGTCITWLEHQCNEDDVHFSNGIQRYLREGDIDWAYWQLNGTQSDSLLHPGHPPLRQHGARDWYGLLNKQWNGPADVKNVERIKALQKMTQHP